MTRLLQSYYKATPPSYHYHWKRNRVHTSNGVQIWILISDRGVVCRWVTLIRQPFFHSQMKPFIYDFVAINRHSICHLLRFHFSTKNISKHSHPTLPMEYYHWKVVFICTTTVTYTIQFSIILFVINDTRLAIILFP